MPQAAIYDLDDTMVNSHPLSEFTWRPLLEKYGKNLDDFPKDQLKTFVGRRVIDIVTEFIDFFDIQEDANVFYKERQKLLLDLTRSKLEMMPGLVYSLDLCKSLKLPIAIASSGSMEYIQTVLEKFHLHHYFDVIVSGDDVTIGKPDPQVFQIACKKLGLPPKDCVVLEDATAGVAAAKAAGCLCIAVRSPYTPVQDLGKADVILNSLEEVTEELIHSL